MFHRNSTNAAFKYFLLCLLEIQPMFEWNINLLCSVGFAWLGPRCLREDTEELQKSYSSKRSRWKGDNHKHGNWSWAIRLEAQRDAGHVRCLMFKRDEQEWSKIFSEAGFGGYSVIPVFGVRSIIEVYP